MGKHSRLNASGSSRWIGCPGSIQAEAAIPLNQQSSSSPAAREGTAAHAVGEFCLREGINAEEMHDWQIGVPIDEVEHADVVMIPPHGSKTKLSDNYDVYEVDGEMSYAVQVYLDFVREKLNELDDPQLFLEQSYDLSWVYPGMFGTADATVSEEFGTLMVGDYKHGKGVPVYIKKDGKLNTQALYYAAGAAHDAGWTHEKVVIAIIQPRCPEVPAIQVEEVDIAWLKSWAENDLRKAAELTDDEDPMLVAGDHCKWCRAGATCEALRNQSLVAAGADFDGLVEELPVPTEADQLGRALLWVPMIDGWIKSVSGEVQRRLEDGQDIPGFKLVRKRANRKIDPALEPADVRKKVIAAARGEAKAADLFDQKLKPLGQLEKASKKLKAALIAGKGLTIKPEGGLTVASESDRREAVSLLANEFDGVEEEQ